MRIKSLLSQIFVNIFGILKGILALKILTSQGGDNYAIISQYLIFSTLIVQYAIFNYDVPFISNLSNNKDNADAFGSVLKILIFNYLILFIITLLFSQGIAEFIWSKSIYTGYVKWIIVYSAILSLNHLAQVISNGNKKFKTTSLLQILQQIFQILALTLGMIGQSIYSVLVYLIVGEILVLMTAFKLVQRPKLNISIIKLKNSWIIENFKIAMPLLIGSIIIWIIMNGGRFAVVQISNLDELSKYAATFSIAILSGLLISPICAVFMPYFSIGDKNKEYSAVQYIISGSLVLLILSSLISIFLIFFGQFILKKISNLEIYVGDRFLMIICISQIIYGQVRLLILYLAVNGNARIARSSLVAGGLIFIFTIYPLTIKWGNEGAAFAILIATSSSLFALRKSIVNIENILTGFNKKNRINEIWAFSIISVMMVTLVKNQANGESLFELILFFIVTILAYIFVLYNLLNIKIEYYKKFLRKFL